MQSRYLFDKVAIVGVGLIGGSIGLAANDKSLVREIIGIGRNLRTLEIAMEYKAVQRISTDYRELSDCDLVVLGTPVNTTIELLPTIAPFLKKGAIVTDVGSTKVKITQEARDILPEGIVFIGGHPMAGSEKKGISGADQYLFENAFYVLTPDRNTPKDSLDRLKTLIESFGAKTILMDPQEHDLSVAAVSHLPHIIASTLVNSLFDFENSQKIALLAAGGFRDTTRIAASNPDMWRDILMTNGEFILHAVDVFRERLNEIYEAIKDKDEKHIYQLLDRAKKLKTGMPANAKGYLPQLWEIVVTVPDRPGIIGYISNILGNEGINIDDIEILRVREGEGGTIRLAFSNEENQKRAAQHLTAANITTRTGIGSG
ncbi:MAG: prephenate dehydrogenase [Peptococcaceae bacterium]|nr:prephenate dehydrogenase [Peptococcaceae bacterium]